MGGRGVGFHCSQSVVARGSWIYLFYKGKTAQGHRRRLLPAHLWCIINRKTDPKSPTVHFSGSFPRSYLSLPSFLFQPHFLAALPSQFCSRFDVQYLNLCVFVVYRTHGSLSSNSQVRIQASHALWSLRRSSTRAHGPTYWLQHRLQDQPGCTVLTWALPHSKFN